MINNLNLTGQIIALLSFVIGTTLLALYLYFGESVIDIFFALGFVVTAVIMNVILFMVILGSAILNRQHRKEGLVTCVLMTLNIPIAILYFVMVVTFPNFSF